MTTHSHALSGPVGRPLKVLSIWHGAVRRLNRERCDALARTGNLDLALLAPDRWSAALPRELKYEKGDDHGYRVITARAWLRSHAAFHFYPRLFSILSAARPDLVDLYEEPYTLIAALVAWWRNNFAPGCRLVFTACQNIAKHYPPPFCWMERYVLDSADAAMALNRGAVEVFRGKGYDGPFEVVPTGIDPAGFRRVEPAEFFTDSPGDRPVVGYVGRLVEEKGVDTLVEAAALGHGEFRVAIVGDGPEMIKLRKQAAEMGIAQSVAFIGPVPSGEIAACISAMDILVLPSRTRPNWKEQLGRALIEAMACEVPVVGSRSGAIPEVIGDAGLLFEEGDAGGLHAAISCLLSDAELRRSLAVRGRRRAETDFAWPAIAQKIRSVWQDALDRPPLEIRRRSARK